MFKDYFSAHADDYSKYRPKYPSALFSYLTALTQEQKSAWDCATGNGQSAVMLANHFSEVIATDASKTQIENAVQKKGISYRVATAEESGITSNSIDLITVAQAFHWFHQEDFTKEVDRVLKGNGILVIWTYNLLSINQIFDEKLHHLYDAILGNYWAFERSMVEDGYQNVQLPFLALESPKFEMSTQWNFSQLIGYLSTWSAAKKYQKERGINPIEKMHEELLKTWGRPDKLQTVTWPLSIKIWRKISL